VILAATDAGVAVAAEVRARLESWFDSQLAALQPEELAKLESAIPVLHKLAAAE